MKSYLKFGIWMGLSSCLLTLSMFFLKLDSTYIEIGQILDQLAFIIPAVFTFLGLRFVSNNTNELSYKSGIKTGLVINLLGFLIYAPFLILYHEFIHPEWLSYVLDFKEVGYIAKGVPEEVRAELLTVVEKSSTNTNHVVSGLIFGVVIMGSVLSLISTAILRKSKQRSA